MCVFDLKHVVLSQSFVLFLWNQSQVGCLQFTIEIKEIGFERKKVKDYIGMLHVAHDYICQIPKKNMLQNFELKFRFQIILCLDTNMRKEQIRSKFEFIKINTILCGGFKCYFHGNEYVLTITLSILRSSSKKMLVYQTCLSNTVLIDTFKLFGFAKPNLLYFSRIFWSYSSSWIYLKFFSNSNSSIIFFTFRKIEF